jgi:sugar O-acyltransferase (sialic acid O-acetyltransferase NeuD family)
VIIVGAGGHGAVVADALLAAGERVIGFVDADPAMRGRTICGLPVLGDDAALSGYSADDVRLGNGIGGTSGASLRRKVQIRLQEQGWTFVQVRHPSAVVSPFAVVGPGAQLMAASVLQPGANLGEGCIVNTGAVLEHDTVIGEFVHIAPGAIVCGSTRVGAGSHIGAGAVVRQGLRLGQETIVGAGAVVVTNYAGGGTLVGTPARPMEGSR